MQVNLFGIIVKFTGQAQENRGDCDEICGAGRHKWEQLPLLNLQWFVPLGCTYGWKTRTTFGSLVWIQKNIESH